MLTNLAWLAATYFISLLSKCILTCSRLVGTNLAWLVVTNMAMWPYVSGH